jgi:hypothetical protein
MCLVADASLNMYELAIFLSESKKFLVHCLYA